MVDLHDIYILLESKGYIVNRIVSEEGNVFRFASQRKLDFEEGIVHFLKVTYYPYRESKFDVVLENVQLYRGGIPVKAEAH
ncbi:hypothetical protein P4661_27515 [Priestia megaterium]|uniref:hypothetical protein n=1 Tax=Priestia megaterium TaxID=1404 RepID=UPI002E24769F|nr:hypothetical protein [Priestia megaterium]